MRDKSNVEQLKASCLKGDSESWKELYREYCWRAEAIAKAPPFCFDLHTAEDIAQATIIELTRQLATVASIPGFVGRVAHNKCVDHVRKKKESLLSVTSSGEDDKPDLVAQMPGPEFLPDQLDDHKALAMLRDVLGAMGPPCRQLLYVRFFEELSYEATAAKVAIPVAQVGVYIERCVRRLRDQIERQPKVWEELKALL